MTKIFTILLAVLSINAFSQTLTQSFNEPVVGDRDRNYRLDTSAYTTGLPLSVTGSNTVWNFVNLTGTFPIVVDSFKLPSAAPGASAYPSATYAQHRDMLYSFYKSTSSPQQTELLGAYSPSLTLTFTNSAIIAGYPVSYGYNLNDPVSGTFKYGTTTGAANGSINITADGTGTLNLYNGVSVPNVLRLKSVETLTLSIGLFPFGSFNQTIYNYYAPGKKFPILNLSYTVYQLLAGTPTITAIIYGSDSYFSIVGLNGPRAGLTELKAYPNPFHNTLHIPADAADENEYLFYNLNGQVVLKSNSANNLPVEKLEPGVYILEVKNGRGVYRQKIVKE